MDGLTLNVEKLHLKKYKIRWGRGDVYSVVLFYTRLGWLNKSLEPCRVRVDIAGDMSYNIGKHRIIS